MYYKTPLRFDNLFTNKNLVLCSLGESIAQHLELITETRYGEHQGDMHFGCELWNFDFQNMIKVEDYERKLQTSLQETVIKYEQRLNDVEVDVSIADKEVYNSATGSAEMKKQAIIIVKGNVKETGEAFYFKTAFHLNPIISI